MDNEIREELVGSMARRFITQMQQQKFTFEEVMTLLEIIGRLAKLQQDKQTEETHYT